MYHFTHTFSDIECVSDGVYLESPFRKESSAGERGDVKRRKRIKHTNDASLAIVFTDLGVWTSAACTLLDPGPDAGDKRDCVEGALLCC